MNYPTSPRRETTSVSKLTVEYLKKFGRNRDLQQYFVLSTPLTTSEENLNLTTQQMETKTPASILIGSKKGPLWSDLNLPSTSRAYEYQKTLENENIDTGRLSSASSVISDKRLEWDSGADVGYTNYYNSKHKEKSLSLPALSTIESSGENSLSSTDRKSKKQTTFAESTPSNNTHKFFQQDETEITAISKENVEENSTPKTTSNSLQKDKSVSLEDTRLKPDCSKKSLSQIDLANIEKSSLIENMYIFSPMFLKTLKDKNEDNLVKTSDKIIQTTLEKVKLSSNTSDVELFETARNNDSSFSKTPDKFLTFTKANSAIQIPTSSSFEYIPGNEYKFTNLENRDSCTSSPKGGNEFELPEGNHNERNTSTPDPLICEKVMNCSYDITTSRSSNSDQGSSGHSIGSILMGSQYSTNLTKDLEHTVSAMRNIIEAKQYSEKDKKRLIRTIVKKIVNTHYDDDPESQFDESLNKNTCSSDNLKSTPTSTNHSNNNVSPEVLSSPTVLTSFEMPKNTRCYNNVSPEVINYRNVSPSFEILNENTESETDDKTIKNDKVKLIPETSTTEEKVGWKRDITFSERLFAERIKNLQNQRHHRDNQKKKRNTFTNVKQLQKKIVKDGIETCGDTVTNDLHNKKLLKITEKEREDHLNWVKSEIYHLNQLRLLLEDSISPHIPTTQVYPLSSNSVKKTSSSSSLDSESFKSLHSTRPSTLVNVNKNKKIHITSIANEIDKIIQKNYILTESSLSNKKSVKSSHKTDQDLQNKIIANIQDAQVKEIWKQHSGENSIVKRHENGSKSIELPKQDSVNLDCNLLVQRDRKSIDSPDISSDLRTNVYLSNKCLNPTVAIQTDKYCNEKHKGLEYSKSTDTESSRKTVGSTKNSKKFSLNSTIAIQTEISEEMQNKQVSDDSKTTNSLNCGRIQQRKDTIKEKVVYSKYKQRHGIFQHYRNSSTQTSDQKRNSSISSEEYVYKGYKSVKVDKETQTENCRRSNKNQFKETTVYSTDNKTSTLNSIEKNKNQCTSPLHLSLDTSSSDSYRNNQNSPKCTCVKNAKIRNFSNSLQFKNQATSPCSIDLKTSTNSKERSERNSSRTYSKISSQTSPEIIHDSDTNSIEFIKNPNEIQKPSLMSLKLKNSKSTSKSKHYPINIPKKIPDVNSINYKTWPLHLKPELYEIFDRFLPNSDRLQLELNSDQNKNNLKFTKKPAINKTSKVCKCLQNTEEEYSPHSQNGYCNHRQKNDNISLETRLPSTGAYRKNTSPEESNFPTSLSVRNVPSSYTTNHYKNQLLLESISRRSPRMFYNSRELSEDYVQTSSKESIILQNLDESPHNENSNHSSRYSRTSSEIVIHKKSPNSIEYHNENFVDKCEHDLHERIQQMLSRCETCSKQRIQKENQPQIKHCSECFCQCLDSNRQITDKCSCKPNMPLCNTCKLNQESHRTNSIAYFLRIESRDDIMVEESQSSSLQRHTAIEEVKIYVPKFVKRGSNVIPNNNAKYVEEIGLGYEKSFQSLKEYLSRNKPEFIHAADSRQQCLKETSKKRDKELMKKVDRNSEPKCKITPKKNKLFSSKKMKEITYRKYRTLPEVEQKKYNMKLYRQRRTNRLMMELFNKRLQQKVHKGELDLSLTKTLL